jgi:dienelactone hydrolase
MDSDGSYPQQLTYGMQPTAIVALPSNPRQFLVTGERNGDEVDQFYLMSAGATPIPLMAGESSVRHEFALFSPDGKFLAYSSNRRVPNTFDVHVLRLSDMRDTIVFTGASASIARAESWSKDDHSLLVTQATSNFNSDAFSVDVRTSRATLLTAHEGDVNYTNVRFGSNDHCILAITDRGRQFAGIARIDGGKTVFLTPDRFDVDEFIVLPERIARTNHEGIAFIWNDRGYGRPALLQASNSWTNLDVPLGVAAALDPVPGPSFMEFSVQSPTHLEEVWRYDFDDRSTHAITVGEYGGVARDSFEQAELIAYKTFDGQSIPAWYYRAKTCAQACPALIEIHGGPEDQMRPWFDGIAQFLVEHGVSVLEPNVRGSTGYGRTYLHLADVRKREDSVKDIDAARSWLIEKGGAAPNHIVVFGASYGGYMTLAALAKYPSDWAGGIDVYGPTNWVTFLEQTAPYRRKNREAVYGSLDRDRSFLESISPINHVNAIKAPVLIFAGQNDPRVPVEQSESFAAALESRHVPVDLVVFGNEGHSVTQRDNRLDMYSRIVDFLKKYAGANV